MFKRFISFLLCFVVVLSIFSFSFFSAGAIGEEVLLGELLGSIFTGMVGGEVSNQLGDIGDAVGEHVEKSFDWGDFLPPILKDAYFLNKSFNEGQARKYERDVTLNDGTTTKAINVGVNISDLNKFCDDLKSQETGGIFYNVLGRTIDFSNVPSGNYLVVFRYSRSTKLFSLYLINTRMNIKFNHYFLSISSNVTDGYVFSNSYFYISDSPSKSSYTPLKPLVASSHSASFNIPIVVDSAISSDDIVFTNSESAYNACKDFIASDPRYSPPFYMESLLDTFYSQTSISITTALNRMQKQLDDLETMGQSSVTSVYYPDRANIPDDNIPTGVPSELLGVQPINITYEGDTLTFADKSLTSESPTEVPLDPDSGGSSSSQDGNILSWLTNSLSSLLTNGFSDISNTIIRFGTDLSYDLDGYTSGISGVISAGWDWLSLHWGDLLSGLGDLSNSFTTSFSGFASNVSSTFSDFGLVLTDGWDWLKSNFWNGITTISDGFTHIWDNFVSTLSSLFLPPSNYWDSKPSISFLFSSHFPFFEQVGSIISNAFNFDNGPLVLSFDWYDIDNILSYPDASHMRTYYVDFTWYDDYKLYLRGGLSVVLYVLAFLCCYRIVGRVFGLGINSAVGISFRD